MRPFIYRRRYTGRLKAVILDWAGTTIDFGCMAPTVAFMEVYKRAGVPISLEEARAPMGAHKRVHLQEIGKLPAVAERWQQVHGRAQTEADIESLYEAFVPVQLACLADYAELCPGTLQAVAALRDRGLKIGSTTGYTAEMIAIVAREAAQRGFEPEGTVCASDVPVGRPSPFMCLESCIQLQVWPVEACVKVDDTLSGIEEGLNAGMWTIGLAVSGNEVGLPLAEWEKLPARAKEERREAAYGRMSRVGAHFVVDGMGDVPRCIEALDQMLGRGERP